LTYAILTRAKFLQKFRSFQESALTLYGSET